MILKNETLVLRTKRLRQLYALVLGQDSSPKVFVNRQIVVEVCRV